MNRINVSDDSDDVWIVWIHVYVLRQQVYVFQWDKPQQ